MAGHRLQHEQRSGDIDVEDARVIAAVYFHNWRGGEYSGVVNQNVDLAKLRHGFGHRGIDAGLIGDIQFDSNGVFTQ